MRKIYYIVLSVVLTMSTASCDSWLDINTDPNKATEVDPDVLYNYAMMSWAANRCSGDLYFPLVWGGQTQSTGGSKGWGNVNVYDISPYSLGNTWKVFYASSGANLQQAIKIAESASPARPNVAAQCKINFAHLVYTATILHGDIPYSEGWNIAIDYPKFDTQKDILEGLIVLLDQAIAQIDVNSRLTMTKYDLAYGGDLDKWVRYANSLKFRIAMVMVDKDPSKTTMIANLLNANKMINSSAGDFKIPFEDAADKENPKFRYFKKYTNGVNIEFFANKLVVDPLNAKNDPRLPKYFDKGVSAATFIGIGANDEAVTGQTALVSSFVFRAKSPELFFSYQEQLFLEAEAYARGLGVAKDISKANQLYKQAMIAAMKYYEVTDADINKYVSENLSDLTTLSDPVREIHLQQWIDFMDRPLEAFTQWRRSGKEGFEVPELPIPRNASPAKLMRRWTYSPDEASANPNTPSVDVMTDKVWFDE
ncbi:SusD-like starch-binding protein associating with outer membrane [Dysgonomonas alginatilytica]|uniref:SusD-like starch-binding protein associating with outer membrane n=1 Tax=Dysgonomonas alginatilytica TaxID=1605892 RepID=A0A2V3PS68_9BACT|nr:SusD/RagB family nutrient-binding outer membrane lipoprotein [Dysgonomonas alginatilytica]PXV68020.1 SusD-like starch-binding protein associating with outer membrane [Dysgonomonas alginatilytica]